MGVGVGALKETPPPKAMIGSDVTQPGGCRNSAHSEDEEAGVAGQLRYLTDHN